MALPTSKYAESPRFEAWRAMVEYHGGVFIGVQDDLFDPAGCNPVVCFRRIGSNQLLSIPLVDFTEATLREKLGQPEPVRKISAEDIKRQVNKAVANALRKLAEEIENES